MLHPMEPLPKTKMEWVVARLRGAINDGSIAPGERIRVQDWASRLNVSTTPIREGLKVLAVEGFVVMSPHQGAVATSFSSRDFEDSARIRAELDRIAGEFTIDRLAPAQRLELAKRLSSLNTRMRSALDRQQPQRAADLSMEFHSEIYLAAGSAELRRSRAALYTEVAVARQGFWKSLSRDTPAIAVYAAEHDDIVAAIEAGDRSVAAERCFQHAIAWSAWLHRQSVDQS
jgi:DNA-binding GntR family transcriptional regulator